MRRKGLNIPIGEIKGQESPKLSKEEAISTYLNILQQSKRNEKNSKHPCSSSVGDDDDLWRL